MTTPATPATPKRRGGPSGPPGRHAQPARILRATPAQLAAWDRAAQAEGRTWTDWARVALDAASAPAGANAKRPRP